MLTGAEPPPEKTRSMDCGGGGGGVVCKNGDVPVVIISISDRRSFGARSDQLVT